MKNTLFVHPPIYNRKEKPKRLVFHNNSGNLLFTEVMKLHIDYQEQFWLKDTYFEKVNNVSAVIPASNFIRFGSTIESYYLNFLKQTQFPVTIAGLGAQSSTTIKTPKEIIKILQPKKVRCLKIFSERAVTLGVRGEFTAQCLEELGIYNYRIIGCPSIFYYFDGIFPKLKEPTLQSLLINITTGNFSETKILEFGQKINAKWIMQTCQELPEVAFDNKKIDQNKLKKSFPDLKLTEDELIYYMRNNAKTFDDFAIWIKYIKESNITFSFGTRFHGNMCALLAGVPALWVTHDSRTEELVKTLHLPNITKEKFDNILNPEELLEYCDYNDFYKNYKLLTKEYIKFLNENELNHKFTINI